MVFFILKKAQILHCRSNLIQTFLLGAAYKFILILDFMMMKVKAAQFFVARAVERITSGRSVGRNNNNNNPKFQDREFVD